MNPLKTTYNFIWFLIKLFKHKDLKNLKVDANTRKKRIDLCYSCEFIKDPNNDILSKIKGSRCGDCGCFVHYKTTYSFEKCPQNKW